MCDRLAKGAQLADNQGVIVRPVCWPCQGLDSLPDLIPLNAPFLVLKHRLYRFLIIFGLTFSLWAPAATVDLEGVDDGR